jgi:type II secretory pathway component GspD/PulD (secretin)
MSRWSRSLIIACVLLLAIGAFAQVRERKIDMMDFEKAEIPMVIKALANVTGANIVIGPDIKGEVTLKLRNVSTEEALKTITAMTGLAYGVMPNGTYVVNTKQKIAEQFIANMETMVLKLRVLSGNDVSGALAVTYKDIQVKTLPDNRIVLAGDPMRLLKAKAFIEEIDVAPMQDDPGQIPEQLQQIEVSYQIKAVVPWQARLYLEELYADRGLIISFAPNRPWEQPVTITTTTTSMKVGDDQKGGEKPSTTKVTVDRTSWESDHIILRGPSAVVHDALNSLKKIDTEVPMVEKRCSVSRIYSSQAIAYLLERFEKGGLSILTAPMTYGDIVGRGATTPEGSKASGIMAGTYVRRDADGNLNVAEPLGDFIIRGPEAVVKEAITALAAIDIGPERVERLVSLRYLEAGEAKKRLEEIYGKDGLSVLLAPSRRGTSKDAVEQETLTVSGEESAQETADKAPADVFELVLRGPDNVVARAVQLLDTLDSEPAQIAIRAEVVTINSTELTNLGIQWGGITRDGFTAGSVGTQFNEVQPPDPLQLGQFVRAPVNITATINALETQNKAKVINRPSTVVQNGRDALIHVGNELYYERLGGYDDGAPIYTIEIIRTGVTLRVRPLASSDGVITLEISTNVTEPPTFRRGISGADLPVVNGNTLSTVIQIRSGETLVIGGLKQDTQSETRQSVPVLSKIPLLGGLFKSKQNTPSQRELVIFVTPEILRALGLPAAAGTTTPAAQ